MGLIGAALGAAGSIFGGIAASKAMKGIADDIRRQQRENQDMYDMRYNEDATQRADAQRLLTMTEESIKRRNRAAAGTAAVMGGTNEAAAAEKAAGNEAMVKTVGQVNANGEARKDKIEQQYLARKEQLDGQMNALRQQKAQAITQAIQGVAGAAGDMDFGELKLGNGKTIGL